MNIWTYNLVLIRSPSFPTKKTNLFYSSSDMKRPQSSKHIIKIREIHRGVDIECENSWLIDWWRTNCITGLPYIIYIIVRCFYCLLVYTEKMRNRSDSNCRNKFFTFPIRKHITHRGEEVNFFIPKFNFLFCLSLLSFFPAEHNYL